MTREESACVSCGLKPCYNCKSTVLVCDHCKDEVDTLYDYDGQELCESCLLESALKTSRITKKKGWHCNKDLCQKHTKIKCEEKEEDELYDFGGECLLCEEAFSDALRCEVPTIQI